MHKLTFTLLVLAAAINAGLALRGNSLNLIAFILLIMAAFATYKSKSKQK